MIKANLTKLEDTIKKGMARFVLVSGALKWGVSTALLFSLLQHFTGNPQTINSVALSLLFFPLAGVFWGALMWWFIKFQYNKSINA